MFAGSGTSDNMPTFEFESDSVSLLDAMVSAKLAPSKAEAKRLIQQGGVSLNDEKVSDINTVIDLTSGAVLKKGKKEIVKLVKK